MRWLHELAFFVMNRKKASTFMGMRERMWLSIYHKFVRKMTANGFLNTGNAPTEESIQSLPDDIEPLTADRAAKNIVFLR